MENFHQNLDSINRLLKLLKDTHQAERALALGYLSATAEVDHVILDDEVLDQIAGAHDLNDATGYYAVWLQKRLEANDGVFKRDW